MREAGNDDRGVTEDNTHYDLGLGGDGGEGLGESTCRPIYSCLGAGCSLFQQYRGAVSVFGGTLTHLTLGTMYCWGNFISYLPPSMLYFSSSNPSQTKDETDDAPDALFVLPITMLFMCISMPISSTVLQRRFGTSACLLVGSCIMSGGVFLASFSTSLESFIFLYCVCFGTGVGVAYTVPIVVGWKWFPTRKGFVSGCVLAGFGSGGFIFNLIGTAIVNPNGLSPISIDEEGDGAYGATSTTFPTDVYSRFPLMLRSLALIYAVLQLIGFLCIRPPVESKKMNGQTIEMKSGVSGQLPLDDYVDKDMKYHSDVELNPTKWRHTSDEAHDYEKEDTAVYEAICTRTFWLLWLCIMFSASAGLNVVSTYKMYGNTSDIFDDGFLALVGGLGSIGNGVGRTFWGYIQDNHGTKLPFMVLTLTQSLVMIFYRATLHSKVLFGLATFTFFLCMGGNFAMAPGACAKLFGANAGPKVFSVLFSAFATAAIVGSALSRNLLASHGFDVVFGLMGVLSIAAGIAINGLTAL